MAKLFKILVIQHLLKGNQIAKSGEEIDGSKFINLQESLDGGFIEEVSEKKDKKDESKDASPLAAELKLVKGFNKEELIKYATENEFEFDAESNKKEILASVIAQIEASEKPE